MLYRTTCYFYYAVVVSLILLAVGILDKAFSKELCQADYDHSGSVDFSDMLLYAKSYPATAPDSKYNPLVDVNGDGAIDFTDLLAFAREYGQTCTSLARPFMLMNNTVWKDVPAPTPLNYGQQTVEAADIFSGKVQIFSHDCLWPGNYPKYDYTHGDEGKIRQCVRNTKDQNLPKIIVFDTETFNIDNRGISDEIAKSEAQKLKDLIDWAKDESSKYKPEIKLQFGHYGEFPLGDYWHAMPYHDCVASGKMSVSDCAKNTEYDKYVKANDLVRSYASNVDIIFPSLYVYYDDPKGWLSMAAENVKEANKYGKPVMTYLWDYYMGDGGDESLRGQHIKGPYWKTMLDFSILNASGTVFWSDLERYSDVKQQDFYKATVDFVAEKKKLGVIGINPNYRAPLPVTRGLRAPAK